MQRFSMLMVVGVLVGACGGEEDAGVFPYAANLTTVIGGDKQANGKDRDRSRVVDTPDADGCIDEDADECLKPQEECGDDGAADLLVDAKGKPLATLCYPTDGVAVVNIDGDLSDVGNNTVFVLDELDDDADVTGNVTLDGNNVTLFGRGPDVSVIGGDLHIDKNNARVRGVRVLGDVIIDKNNPSLVDCVIEGDLIIHGNNVAVALCEVWGDVIVDGNNAFMVENYFAHAPEIAGNNTVCSGNVAFEDANADATVADEELAGPIVCAEADEDI
jgi:hypothetical protein